jgi:uncharacterized protein YndB with AHSA1/START domain
MGTIVGLTTAAQQALAADSGWLDHERLRLKRSRWAANRFADTTYESGRTDLMRRSALVLAMLAVLGGSTSAQNVGPIVHEGIVEASLERVWTAFTTSEGLRSWLAPHAEIDLRIGGLMRTNYNPQGQLGDPQTIENTILSFEPGRMLSIRVSRAPDSFPFPNAVRDMWSVVYFAEAGPSRTTVREVSLGFSADEESQRMRAFFNQGNATTLHQLQKHFAGSSR